MTGFIPLTVALLFVPAATLLVHLLLKSFRKEQQPHADLPQGSMGWLSLGETLAFLKPHPPNSMGSFLQQHCSKYGKVFKSHLFGSPAIVSCDHELNQFILQNEEKLFMGSYPKTLHGIVGNLSVLTASGDLHKKLRSHVVRFAAKYRTPEYLNCIEELSISMMESWKGQDQIFFHNEARKFLFYLTVKQVLSIEPEQPLATKILDDFLKFMKGFVSIPLSMPGTAYFKAVKARARISSNVKEIMRGRRHYGLKKGGLFGHVVGYCKPK
ncbi:hypothetical protein Ancab_002710 [Ancistrocladus abbreviatus]